MSLKNVKAFYERLARDESFCDRIQNSTSKEECSQIVREAGYKFTPEEFEEYTAQFLESTADENELREIDAKELEAVVGGASSVLGAVHLTQPKYGGVRPIHPPIHQDYGVVILED